MASTSLQLSRWLSNNTLSVQGRGAFPDSTLANFKHSVGGLLTAKVKGNIDVRVHPSIEEGTSVSVSNPDGDLDVVGQWLLRQDDQGNVTISNTSQPTPGTTLTINVPVRTNVEVSAIEGQVHVMDYLEGDLKVQAGQDISVRKARGAMVSLKTAAGDIAVNGKVEASELTIETKKGNVSAQKVLTSQAAFSCFNGNLKVGSMYVDHANVNVTNGGIDISGVHGSLSAGQQGTAEPVAICAVNGQLDGTFCGGATVQFDSLFAGSSSSVECKLGTADVAIPTDQVVAISSTCKVGSTVFPPSAQVEQRAPGNPEQAIIRGAKEPSRAEHRPSGGAGKINVDEAGKLGNLWGAQKVAAQLESENIQSSANATLSILADHVTVEVLGWRERIERRFRKPLASLRK